MPTRAERRQRLFEVASSQGGYFTAAQARKLGYDTSTITHQVSFGSGRGLSCLWGIAPIFYRCRFLPLTVRIVF